MSATAGQIQNQDTRERILAATARLLARDGTNAVTIAAVAREAKVSKGGLFYHFPSKDALIDGLVVRYIEDFDRLIAAAGDEPGAATLAWLASAEQPSSPATRSSLALLSAATASPRALAALRVRYRAWQDRLDRDRIPADVAGLVRATVDGLWLADAFDLAPVAPQTRRHILDRLRRIVAAAGARD